MRSIHLGTWRLLRFILLSNIYIRPLCSQQPHHRRVKIKRVHRLVRIWRRCSLPLHFDRVVLRELNALMPELKADVGGPKYYLNVKFDAVELPARVPPVPIL